VSYGEIFVFITAAGLVVGKNELILGARFLGGAIGQVVGLLQGLSAKYHDTSRKNKLYKLGEGVKKGLDELSAIKLDLYSIGNSRFIPGKFYIFYYIAYLSSSSKNLL